MKRFFAIFTTLTDAWKRRVNCIGCVEIENIKSSIPMVFLVLLLGCDTSINKKAPLGGRNQQAGPEIDRESPIPTDMSRAGLDTVYDILSRNPAFAEFFGCFRDSLQELGHMVSSSGDHTWFVPLNADCGNIDIRDIIESGPTARWELLSDTELYVVEGELDIAHMLGLVRDSLSRPVKSVSNAYIKFIELSGGSIAILAGKDTALITITDQYARDGIVHGIRFEHN